MINSDKKKVTVDFHWTESKDGYGVYIKHHYTEEYGPTISVSETEGDYISFPSKMFAEAVDFLRAEGHIEGEKKPKPPLNTPIPREAAMRKTKLSPPVIEDSSAPQEEEVETTEIIIDSSNPIGSFDGEDVSYLPSETPQVAPETPQMSNTSNSPSSQEMALERQVATDKQQSGEKTIRSRHKEE